MWKGAGSAGLNFLNVLPKLGITVKNFFGNLFTDVFNSIYNQQIDQKSARNVIVSFFVIIGVYDCYLLWLQRLQKLRFFKQKIETKKPEPKIKKETKKPEPKIKKETKKPEPKIKKETKKPEPKIKKETKKPELKSKKK